MIQIKSICGFTLNPSDFVATAVSAKTPGDAMPVFISQTNASPKYSRAYTLDVKTVAIGVRIVDYANRDALEAQLKEGCRPGMDGVLVATFSDDGRDYQLYGVVQSIHLDPKNPLVWTIVFKSEESTWKTVDEETATDWDITASGQTKTLTVGGYSKTRMSLDVEITGLPATGWAYRKAYQLINHVTYRYGMRPWCISLDTATLVTAGKMQADCDDIRVVVDGKLANRWIATPNNAATKIWINVNQEQGATLVSRTAIGATGAISSIQFVKNSDTKSALKRLPSHGLFVCGSEWFEYKSINLADYSVEVVGRAVYDTTMGAHSSGASFNFMEHAILILYGNMTVGAPDLASANYDDQKPMFDLAASDNGQFVYDTTSGFYDPARRQRSGAFQPTLNRVGTESEFYITYNDPEAANSGMGMQIETYYKGGVIQAEKATVAWQFSWPGRIATVSMTGRKYRTGTPWAGTTAVRLEYSNNLSKWVLVWSEGTPSSALTWQSITKATQNAHNAYHVRFALIGTLPKVDTENDFEVLTCTIDVVDASNPTGTLLSEVDNCLMDLKFINQTNGDEINLLYPIRLNNTISMDGEKYEAVIGSGSTQRDASAAFTLDDESRDVWMRLEPGENVIEVSGDVVPELTVVCKWYERRL